eukprot:7002508-Prymnesium_polylepis.1
MLVCLCACVPAPALPSPRPVRACDSTRDPSRAVARRRAGMRRSAPSARCGARGSRKRRSRGATSS